MFPLSYIILNLFWITSEANSDCFFSFCGYQIVVSESGNYWYMCVPIFVLID